MEGTSLLGCLLECGLNSYTCLKSLVRIILVLQTDSLSVCLRFHSVSIVLVFTSKYCKSHSAIMLYISCLVEEVEDIKPMIRGMNDDISFLILNVARLGKEIEVMKTAHVRKRDECMKNVVVCGVGMAILCYYYFFV
ncbi:hypothetical protein Bca4012_084005 [Brassica carinata]